MKTKTLVMAIAIVASTQTANATGDALNFFLLQKQSSADASATTDVKTKRKQSSGRSLSSISTLGLGPAAADVARLAEQNGLPRNLALSVCRVESRCRYGLVGMAGERGPMQIKLQTARGLGYTGNAAGLNGYTGAYWGVKHLAVAYRKCGTARGAAKLHNAGLASSCTGSQYASRVVAGL
ncbi:MAG: lytic transglycosylase domain-containing protein [Beijerinckiaceae bacterium]